MAPTKNKFGGAQIGTGPKKKYENYLSEKILLRLTPDQRLHLEAFARVETEENQKENLGATATTAQDLIRRLIDADIKEKQFV